MLLSTHLSKLLWVQNSFPSSCRWGNRQGLDSCVAVDRPEIPSLASCLHVAIWLSYVQTAYTIKCMWLLLLVLLSCHKCSDPQQKRLMAFLSWCHWPSRAVKNRALKDWTCSVLWLVENIYSYEWQLRRFWDIRYTYNSNCCLHCLLSEKLLCSGKQQPSLIVYKIFARVI